MSVSWTPKADDQSGLFDSTTHAGKVAIVTGGGTGIGMACAERLAQAGASIVATGRRSEPLDAVVSRIKERGGNALAVSADLTEAADAQRLVQLAMDEFGRVDLAVNSAGAVGVGSLVDTQEKTFDEVIAANVKATWLAMKHQIPAIHASGGGAIVNVASRAGLVGVANGSIYSAAKHAVIGLTRSAALEAASLGIRVNAVCPGPTLTDQFADIVGKIAPDASVDAAAKEFGSKLPLGRIADPREIAEAIVWLLGPGASFVTGAVVPVDGGSSAG
jgi:NAD(P)-dependent dehydrogenase (short-subunit alcohol dehydrogenase family)